MPETPDFPEKLPLADVAADLRVFHESRIGRRLRFPLLVRKYIAHSSRVEVLDPPEE